MEGLMDIQYIDLFLPQNHTKSDKFYVSHTSPSKRSNQSIVLILKENKMISTIKPIHFPKKKSFSLNIDEKRKVLFSLDFPKPLT